MGTGKTAKASSTRRCLDNKRYFNIIIGDRTKVGITLWEKIMEIDLSLNRSLEELISSYFEAYEAGFGCDSFLGVNTNATENDVSCYYVLENYLSDMGAIWEMKLKRS